MPYRYVITKIKQNICLIFDLLYLYILLLKNIQIFVANYKIAWYNIHIYVYLLRRPNIGNNDEFFLFGHLGNSEFVVQPANIRIKPLKGFILLVLSFLML